MLPAYKRFSYNGDPQGIYSALARTTIVRPMGATMRRNDGMGDDQRLGHDYRVERHPVPHMPPARCPMCASRKCVQQPDGYHHLHRAVTDDSHHSSHLMFELPAGTTVTLLAYENFVNHWAYIETYYEGQPIRGFINRERLRVN